MSGIYDSTGKGSYPSNESSVLGDGVLVGGFDIDGCDVIGQQQDFIGMNLRWRTSEPGHEV